MANSLEDQLLSELKMFDIEAQDSSILPRLCELSLQYSIKPDDFISDWISFSLTNDANNQLNLSMSLDQLKLFEYHLEKQYKAKDKSFSMSATPSQYAGKKRPHQREELNPEDMELIHAYADDKTKIPHEISILKTHLAMEDFDDIIENNDYNNDDEFGMNISGADVKLEVAEDTSYGSRQNSGKITINFNDSLLPEKWKSGEVVTNWTNPDITTPNKLNCPIKLVSGDQTILPLTKAYKYMHLREMLIITLMDEYTQEMGEKILDAYRDEIQNFASLEETTFDKWYFGRVMCDPEHSEITVKLNTNSLALLGSNETSNGHWVKLDLSKVTEYRLFPGQIIAVKGHNDHRKQVNYVEDIRYGVVPPSLPYPITEMKHIIYIAGGPFTTEDNLKYQPMKDFLKIVSEAKPEVLIIFGPFVDAENKAILTPEMTKTPDVLTNEKLGEVVKAAKDIGCQLILVPSLRELCHHPIYPQPPYAQKLSHLPALRGMSNKELGDVIYTFPEPAQFDLNGVRFAITSTDIITHLAKQEISLIMGDKFSRLLSSILQQQLFYPLNPSDLDVNIEITKSMLHARIHQKPHILITVSKMHEFIKTVHDTVCINPGRLTKGRNGGSFCRLVVTSTGVGGQVIKI